MPRADRELLPHVAALAEIDPAHGVHVAFQRQRGVAHDLALPFGDSGREAASVVVRDGAGGLRGKMGGWLGPREDQSEAHGWGSGVVAADVDGGGRGRGGTPGAPDGPFGFVEDADLDFGAELEAAEVGGEAVGFARVDFDEEGGVVVVVGCAGAGGAVCGGV